MSAKQTAASVRALVNEYLKARRVGDTQARVLEKITRVLGPLRVEDLTPSRMQDYQRRVGGADATRRRELGALQAVLHWAERAKILPRGSAPLLDLPPPGQARQAHLDPVRERAFHNEAVAYPRFGGRVGLFVSLALNTGARREAIEGLTWDRVDLSAGLVDFREPSRSVSKKRRVVVPINARLRTVLAGFVSAPVDSSGYVLGECAIRYPYECFVRDLKMPWVTPHVLRHTAATLMLQRGQTLWDVAGVLGATPETVSRVYGHHTPNHLRGAVAALG